jgi:hypothetical protein
LIIVVVIDQIVKHLLYLAYCTAVLHKMKNSLENSPVSGKDNV